MAHDHVADVAVIGGGLAGLATAQALRARGADVLVLERDEAIGQRASGRHAGLARQLVDDDATTALTVAGVAWLRARGAAVGFEPTGSYLLFDDDEPCARYLARAGRHGVVAEWARLDGVRAAWPQLPGAEDGVALHVPGDGTVMPGALLAHLAAGLRVLTACEVRGGDATALSTSRGTVVAGQIVVAAGAWGAEVGRALGATPPALTPMKRHVALFAGAASGGAPFVWRIGPREAYVRPHPDGVLASPCDARPTTPDDDAVDLDTAGALRAFAGPLADAPAQATWACLRTFGPDGHPFVTRDARLPWLTWIVGLGGHGATCAGVLGERAAEIVQGRA